MRVINGAKINLKTEKINVNKQFTRTRASTKKIAVSQEGNLNSIEVRSIIELLKSLEEREQMVLSLFYEQQLNFTEIGAVMGIDRATAIKIYSKGMDKLP